MNQTSMIQKLSKFFLVTFVAAILLSAGSAPVAEVIQRGEVMLHDTYRVHLAALGKSGFGLPVLVESLERDDRAHVDVYGIFNYPFDSVADALKVPAHWCDIVSISPNVKACTHREQGGDRLLTMYVGRRTYKTPEDSRQVVSRFRIAEQRDGYLDIMLTADSGPYGTRNYRMRFKAVPVAGGRTFVHVSFAYSESAALRMAEKAYFATLGRDKVGFTVTGTDENGKPVHVGGRRGAIERNTVRYYFAIQSFLKMLRLPAEQRFTRSIGEWYDLTARYRNLDFGMDKKDYLTIKARERKNQLALQQRIGTGLQ